jgi:hypothetical protein
MVADRCAEVLARIDQVGRVRAGWDDEGQGSSFRDLVDSVNLQTKDWRLDAADSNATKSAFIAFIDVTDV